MGSVPYKICRNPVILGWLGAPIGCPCHIEADKLATKTPNKLTHTDRTADTAIGNIMNPRSKT